MVVLSMFRVPWIVRRPALPATKACAVGPSRLRRLSPLKAAAVGVGCARRDARPPIALSTAACFMALSPRV